MGQGQEFLLGAWCLGERGAVGLQRGLGGDRGTQGSEPGWQG